MPPDEEFNLLGKWLTTYKLSSNYSVLSRMVFSKLNWSCPDLLPWHRQSSLALFVIKSFHVFAPDCIAGNFLQDGVRQVSNIANKLRRTPEQVFTSWAWEMCSRLRLHRNDTFCKILLHKMIRKTLHFFGFPALFERVES